MFSEGATPLTYVHTSSRALTHTMRVETFEMRGVKLFLPVMGENVPKMHALSHEDTKHTTQLPRNTVATDCRVWLCMYDHSGSNPWERWHWYRYACS